MDIKTLGRPVVFIDTDANKLVVQPPRALLEVPVGRVYVLLRYSLSTRWLSSWNVNGRRSVWYTLVEAGNLDIALAACRRSDCSS